MCISQQTYAAAAGEFMQLCKTVLCNDVLVSNAMAMGQQHLTKGGTRAGRLTGSQHAA